MKKQGAIWKSGITKNHYHIAFIREDGVGVSSNSGEPEHVHILMLENDTFVYQPAPDGHVHTLGVPLEKSEGLPEKETTDKEKIASEVVSLYKYALQTEEEARDNGIESEGFYDGTGHWENGARQKLQEQDRCYLTLNHTQANVDLMSGYQRQNRTDIRCLPMEGGDNVVADTYTIVIKNILDQCNFPLEETNVFKDELISGRGIFNIYVDYDSDAAGKIIVERFPWEDFAAGPHDKLDFSDAEHVHKARWYPISRVLQIWPKTKTKINSMLTGEKDVQADNEVFRGQDLQYYKVISPDLLKVSNDSDLVNKSKKQIKVIETWRKEYYPKKTLLSQANHFSMEVTNWTPEDLDVASHIPDFDVVESNGMRMRITLTAANVLIDDTYADADVQDYSCVPSYAHKQRDNFWGIVEVIKDAQREINFRHSQSVDIVNAMAAYGWFVKQDTFVDHHEEEKFKNTSSSPGFVVKIQNEPPIQTQGTKIPAEVLQMEQLAEGKLKTLLNLPDLPRDPNSGKQIIEYRRTGLVGSDYLFDNLDFAKKKIGRILIKLIQKLYTPERIIRLVQDQAMKETVRLGNESVQGKINDDFLKQVQRMLETEDLVNYDVIVDISPYSASSRRANFQYWLQAAQFVPTPPEFLLELSDLPEKEKYGKILAVNAERQAKIEQQKNQAEIQKTLIAASARQGAARAGVQGNQVIGNERIPAEGGEA